MWSTANNWLNEKLSARWFQFVKDCLMVLFEALIILAIVHIPLFLSLIYKKMGQENTSIIDTFLESYQVGDVLGYVAGLLASSTAYFFVRFKYARYKPYTMGTVVLAPIILLFFTAPIFFRNLDGEIPQGTFTNNYIATILVIATIIWLYSLYQQKAISRISKATPIEDIMNKVKEPKS